MKQKQNRRYELQHLTNESCLCPNSEDNEIVSLKANISMMKFFNGCDSYSGFVFASFIVYHRNRIIASYSNQQTKLYIRTLFLSQSKTKAALRLSVSPTLQRLNLHSLGMAMRIWLLTFQVYLQVFLTHPLLRIQHHGSSDPVLRLLP